MILTSVQTYSYLLLPTTDPILVIPSHSLSSVVSSIFLCSISRCLGLFSCFVWLCLWGRLGLRYTWFLWLFGFGLGNHCHQCLIIFSLCIILPAWLIIIQIISCRQTLHGSMRLQRRKTLKQYPPPISFKLLIERRQLFIESTGTRLSCKSTTR